jgi:hypothetical protein
MKIKIIHWNNVVFVLGVVGSVMAKEGRLPDFSGIVSSGFKVSFL